MASRVKKAFLGPEKSPGVCFRKLTAELRGYRTGTSRGGVWTYDGVCDSQLVRKTYSTSAASKSIDAESQ